MDERILIVGAGAVGSYVGGHFARAGLEVILVDPWPAHVEHIQARGLRLEGMTSEECFESKPRAMHFTDLQILSKEKPADIAFICVKSYTAFIGTDFKFSFINTRTRPRIFNCFKKWTFDNFL